MPRLDIAFSESRARQFVESPGRQRDTPQITRWNRWCHVQKEMGGINSFLYFPQLSNATNNPFELDRRLFSRWDTITDKVDYVQGVIRDDGGNISRNATDVHYTGTGQRIGPGLHAISSGCQDIPHPGNDFFPPQLPQRFYRYGPPDPVGQFNIPGESGAAPSWPYINRNWDMVADFVGMDDTSLGMHHTPIDTGDPNYSDADITLRSELSDPTDCSGMFSRCRTDLKNEVFPVPLTGGPSRLIIYNDGFGSPWKIDNGNFDTQAHIPSLYDGALQRIEGFGLSDIFVFPYLDYRVISFSGWALSPSLWGSHSKLYLEPDLQAGAAFGFPDLFLARGQFGLAGYGRQPYWIGRCRTCGPSTGNMRLFPLIGDGHWLCTTEVIETGIFTSSIVAEITFPDDSSPYPLQQIGDGMVAQDVIFFALGEVPTNPNDLLTPGAHFAPP